MSTPRDFGAQDIFVSPLGNDAWEGRLGQPNEQGSNGPLRTIVKAQQVVALRKKRGEFTLGTTVWLRGGEYGLTKPLRFGPEDGNITLAAYPGETPVLSCGVRISGWEDCQINGVGAWRADVADVLEKRGYFQELFVNGRRGVRPRWPKEGFFQIEEIPENKDSTLQTGTFRAQPGHMKTNWKNAGEIEIVTFCLWVEQRLILDSYEENSRVVKFKRAARPLCEGLSKGNARYYLENIAEELAVPGEWYLDKKAKTLYYIPRAGETMETAEVIVPVGVRLVEVLGEPESNRPVENLSLRGLTFAYTDWRQPRRLARGEKSEVLREYHGFGREFDVRADPQEADRERESSGTSQSSMLLPGALYFQGARNCVVEDCQIRHVGWHGIELGDGCKGNRLIGNTISDTGGGGIKVNGRNGLEGEALTTGCNLITDNHIHSCGHVFPGATGILIMHSYGNLIAHNHVHDMYYTAISLGATWGYSENPCRNNRVEKNIAHDVGKKVLSDCAGIYLLGVHTGTSVRHNVVYDITKYEYGAFGINLDEGIKGVLVEGNLFYNIESQIFHLHYGEENIVRNNVFIVGDEGGIGISRGVNCRYTSKGVYGGGDISRCFTFERNIVVTDGQPLFVGGLGDTSGNLDTGSILSDLNLFYDVKKEALFLGDGEHGKGGHEMLTREITFAEWQDLGQDTHSVVADPEFVNAGKGDFALKSTSPAFALGFVPLQVSDAGVRPPERRTGWLRKPLTEQDTEKFGYW